MSDNLREAALEYHRLPTPGKISVMPTKAMATQRDPAGCGPPGSYHDALLHGAADRQHDRGCRSRCRLGEYARRAANRRSSGYGALMPEEEK